MATLRINCVDSMGYISPFPEGTESAQMLGKVCGVADDQEAEGVTGIRYNVGYHQNAAEFLDGLYQLPVIFIFETPDLEFLNTANVASAKLCIKCAVANGDGSRGIVFQTLTARPEIRAGYLLYEPVDRPDYVKPGHIAQLQIYESGSRFYSVDSVKNEETVEIDLSNAIDTIKNISEKGLKISGTARAYSTTMWYGIMAASNLRPYIEIEYEVPDISPRVSPVSPVSTIVNGDQPVTFTWNYSQPNSMPQSHFQIQQYVGSAWQNIVGKTAGTQTEYTAPANTFAAGQGQWRVMVWCQNGTIASEWSDPAYIIVQIQPKAPTITSAGTTPSPTFTWQAAQQQGYEIKLGSYTTGTVYGTEKSWTYPGVLPDGNITFSIRTQNQQGVWSPWSSTETYISNTPSGTLPLSVQARDNAVTLTWAGNFSSYRVYRDGACIAQVTGLQFTDYLSAGKCTYQVYGMLQGGNYTPSASITEIVRPKCAVISDVENISWIPLRLRSGSRPSRSDQIAPQVSLVHYQGRSLPVPYMPGFMDVSHTFNFTLDRPETYQALQALAGKVVILKHRRERFIGVLTGISAEKTRMADVSFSIVETDYKEGPENA